MHKDQLQSWSEYHASVVRYHRPEVEKELATDFIELDDEKLLLEILSNLIENKINQ